MEMNSSFGTWTLSSSENGEKERNQGDKEEEEEETLSLCDLPINEDDQSRNEDPENPQATKIHDDFDFCSFNKESQMVAADEVFFQGQILPLRHSVGFETAVATSRSNSHNTSRSISRSESMERSNSSGFTSSSCRSSRSSSIRSSSTGSSSTNTPIYKPRMRSNHFHSHPSPKAQIKLANIKAKSVGNSNQKSTMWSHFRLGLLTTPEIALQDLKFRSNNVGSRNSTSSSSSSLSNGADMKSTKKKNQTIFDKNGVFFGGCKCSINAVETVDSRVTTNRRSVISGNDETYSHDQEVDHLAAVKGTKQHQQQQQQGKVTSSRNRTFEWLKQLSLDEAAKIDNL